MSAVSLDTKCLRISIFSVSKIIGMSQMTYTIKTLLNCKYKLNMNVTEKYIELS